MLNNMSSVYTSYPNAAQNVTKAKSLENITSWPCGYLQLHPASSAVSRAHYRQLGDLWMSATACKPAPAMQTEP